MEAELSAAQGTITNLTSRAEMAEREVRRQRQRETALEEAEQDRLSKTLEELNLMGGILTADRAHRSNIIK